MRLYFHSKLSKTKLQGFIFATLFLFEKSHLRKNYKAIIT